MNKRVMQPLFRLMDGQPCLWEAADSCLVDNPEDERWDILDIVRVVGYV